MARSVLLDECGQDGMGETEINIIQTDVRTVKISKQMKPRAALRCVSVRACEMSV